MFVFAFWFELLVVAGFGVGLMYSVRNNTLQSLTPKSNRARFQCDVGASKPRCFVTNKTQKFWKIRNKQLVSFEFNYPTATRPPLV